MSKEFKVGDRVVFTEDYGTKSPKGTAGTVARLSGTGIGRDERRRTVTQLVFVDADSGEREIGVFDSRLEHEEVAQPVHFRICVGTQIGTKEYLTLEAAKEAAVEHGNANEEFSIFEVVLIASYVVKAAKYLEEK